ncbi:MAG: tRNA (adenosine(37)-N6)-threonylcarbamoyltransferase complex dimerization subunit type 1 TsaB [Gammaproteobacteria bacterium]|nr:tRNA (adenosine(37)-N6)-threonylcarbamoyltransferase complex dimerization subunit type 1 TsaB [Gammaproteobacteria bacterium]
MKLLALDTSTEACSAALSIDGEIKQHYQVAPREHTHLILGMIESLLQDAGLKSSDIDVMAFGRGPGSFMGVRVAAGVVQGIAFAHSIPVVPVSTLAAMASVAMQETGQTQVLAAIDARMKEVYWGAYCQDEAGQIVLQGEECVVAPEQAPVPAQGEWLTAGTGWASYGAIMRSALGERCVGSLPDCFPSAEAIARLAISAYQNGGAVTAAEAVPVYLRDNVASKPKSAL